MPINIFSYRVNAPTTFIYFGFHTRSTTFNITIPTNAMIIEGFPRQLALALTFLVDDCPLFIYTL